jgi:uncharacterized metal-binding protein
MTPPTRSRQHHRNNLISLVFACSGAANASGANANEFAITPMTQFEVVGDSLKLGAN